MKEYAPYILGTLLISSSAFIGLTMLVLGFPGTLAILGLTALFAWFYDFSLITGTTLFVMTGMMIAAEGMEFILGYLGAKKFGSSRRAAIAAILGGFVGSMIGLLFSGVIFAAFTSFLGLFIGTFLGAFVAAYLENPDFGAASNVGKGAFLGRVFGLAAKVFFALGMIVTAFLSLFL